MAITHKNHRRGNTGIGEHSRIFNQGASWPGQSAYLGSFLGLCFRASLTLALTLFIV